MKKWIPFLLTFCAFAFSLSGCGAEKKPLPEINLTIWCDDSNIEFLKTSLDDFKKLYESDAVFNVAFGAESEISCKETVLANPETAADIFVFADDQFDDLRRGGALLEITENADAVIDSVGGRESGAAKAAMYDGKLYAYPETAGNGYFLYYRPSYFSEKDVETLDGILAIAEKNGKQFTMDFSSGWYLYSFFKGAGLDLSYDAEAGRNICDWNAKDKKYAGLAVAQAMARIASHKGFVALTDENFQKGAAEGSIIAAVNGAWNYENLQRAWGDDVAAAKLPTYTLDGEQVQMCSFTGYKLVGVNAYSKEPLWSMRLAEYITGKDVQLKRFEVIGECPANLEAASSDEVQASPAMRALSAQSRFGYTQNVADPFWNAAALLGTTIAAGNPDGKDMQELLDRMVEATQQPVAQ